MEAGVIEGIYIKENELFENLNGLEKVLLTQDLFVQNNNSLRTLQGPENLTKASRRVRIEDNPNLESLSGLNNSKEIGEDFYLKLPLSVDNLE